MKKYNLWVAYLTINFQNLFSRRKILPKAFNSHMICYIVINNFFVSFEISVESYNSSQNTFRLTNEFNKCIPSFMESLSANYIQFFSAIAKFLFLQQRLGTRLLYTQFRDFTKIFSFSMSFDNSCGKWYIHFLVIMI